jgi:hypothetical protein
MRYLRVIAVAVVLSCTRHPSQRTRGANQPIPTSTTDLSSGVVFDEPPLQVSADVTAPVPITRLEPALPERLAVAGPLVLKAVIDERGNVRDVRVVRDGTSPPVGPAYVAAVKQWKFRPGTLRGKPVVVEYDISVLIHVR